MDMREMFTIDGRRFSNMAGFYDEVEQVFICGLDWKIGRNLNAFNDILRGGFGRHEYGQPIHIQWLAYEKSVRNLGKETMDTIVEIILDTDHSGHDCKAMPKGSFIVAKTGVHPMKVKLRLFLDWGIRFGEPYEVPEKAQRAVAYADKQELEESIIRRHYGTVAEEEPPQDVPAAVGGMNHGMQAEKNSRKTILRP